MAVVRVYNDNKHPYIEHFEDNDIVIDPGAYVLMEESQAIKFKGSFKPVILTAQKTPDPKHFKMIRIAPHTAETVVQPVKFMCQFDGKEFGTQAELDAYIDENHLDKLDDQEFAQKRRKQKAQ